jgi:RNA polymerase-interacting CarD/CdnL/TRCF family regulator
MRTEVRETKPDTDKLSNFRLNRVKELRSLYSDELSSNRLRENSTVIDTSDISTAAKTRKELTEAENDTESVIKNSQVLYATNPIYASLVDYFSNIFMWRYKVTPHKNYAKSKAKAAKKLSPEEYGIMYNLMLEVADGLSIETKFPSLLTSLYINGAVYFTTDCDTDTITISTLILPPAYCKKVAETQFGTGVIQFDMSYFDSLNLKEDVLKKYLHESFPKEFYSCYTKYKKDPSDENKWPTLDPRFSSCLMVNDSAIPNILYANGGIKNYEQYQDNELERNENLLKYLVIQTIPHFETTPLFDVPEVKALHQSLRKIIDNGEKSRLITTYGDVHVEKIADNDTTANDVLNRSYSTIYNNAGLNSSMFTESSVEAIKISVNRDKSQVWKYVQSLTNFYTIAINNWFDFKTYQADIDILPISQYTYNDDIERYRANASLGVGKLDYIIASGVKQKNIQDTFDLEDYLKLDNIKPMATSYTQTDNTTQKSNNKESTPATETDTSENDTEPSDSSSKSQSDTGDNSKN